MSTRYFVQEKNDGSLHEPSRITDGVKQGQGFLHTVLVNFCLPQSHLLPTLDHTQRWQPRTR
jgi:hypothetical protein